MLIKKTYHTFIVFCCLALGMGMTYYSKLPLSIAVFLFLLICSAWCLNIVYMKQKNMGYFIIFCIVTATLHYQHFNMNQIMKANNTLNQKYATQSLYYNEGYPNYNDILIKTIVRNKNVYVPNKNVWYFNYFKAYANDIYSLEREDDMAMDDWGKDAYFYNAGKTLITSNRPLISKEAYLAIKAAEPYLPMLYVSTVNLEDAEDVLVLSNLSYDLFLMPLESYSSMKGEG